MQKSDQSDGQPELSAPSADTTPGRRRWPLTGVAGAIFWLAIAFILIWLLRLAHIIGGRWLGLVQLLIILALVVLAVVFAVLLVWRLVQRHLLWSLRNKLILTYLLIGLAPVVLFVTLVTISAYIAAGQFSIHLADTRMQQQLDELGVESSTRVGRLARVLRDRGQQPAGTPQQGRLEPPRRGPRPGGTGSGGGATPAYGQGTGRSSPLATARRSAVRAAQAASAAADQAAAAAQLAAQLAAQTNNQTAAVGEAAPDPLLARLRRRSLVYLNGEPYVTPLPFAGPSFAGTSFAAPSSAGPAAAPSTANAGQPNSAAPQPNPTPQPSQPMQPGQSPQTGQPTQGAPGQLTEPRGLPSWATDLHGNQFRGLVLDGHDLFLVSIDQRRIEGSGVLTVVSSMPVDSALLDVVAQGLGRVQLSAMAIPAGRPAAQRNSPPADAPSSRNIGRRPPSNNLQSVDVYGGTEPTAVAFYDFSVSFTSTLDGRYWRTGDLNDVPILVHSRPSVLYYQLFGSSLGGIVTRVYRIGLIALCIVFALIELLALWMALRLSGEITTSVEELYAATQRVDRGDLVHRIAASPVAKRDQLGELARSFNRMTGSLERLLIEQHEKERMQSELAIAQEVQTNLFPRPVRDLPTLQLHGICRPARSVSGDYYDFLVFRHPDNPDGSRGVESGVGIAVGDISGKGISAALLMATLHSAVRAYRLAGEDLVYSESAIAALTASREDLAGDSGKLFESPGRILSLLNRHLYRSTQPEKYATLFLAHYDAATSQLIYSNAGHLPPLVLSRDGQVRRLDHGGTVVGLMDGMRYEEDRFQMKSGDILVTYSDGITEPENDLGEFGEQRLMEIVARFRDQPLNVISDNVLLAVDEWIGNAEQPDDITLVLARQV